MSSSIFDKFTNLYSLSKTLRFELKPVGKTQEMLEEAQVFAKDEIIQKKYEKTKPYFNRLHRVEKFRNLVCIFSHKEKSGCEKMNWGDLYVSGKEWDEFARS